MRVSIKIAIVVLAAFLALQLYRPAIPARPPAAEAQFPPQVEQILQQHCYSCHSDQRRLAWFDYIQPAYSLARYDVLTARQHLDFSTLGAKPSAAQNAALYEAVNMIQLGAMPLPRFLAAHPDARITPEELQVLKTYLAPWSTAPPPAPVASAKPAAPFNAVLPEPNGIPFDPSFRDWKLISLTDRGDNHTLRFILGNDVAYRAAQAGQITPWPDGARFAKIAWQQQLGSDRLIHPGAFVQVELMIKGAQPFKSTDGWGWARWRGTDLKPYGANASFVNECTGCHQPVLGNDFVYTLPITAAPLSKPEIGNNHAAALAAGLPHNPLAWDAVTIYVDPEQRSVSALFADPLAMSAVRERRVSTDATSVAPVYPQGAVLALVTWAERDDPHWFGARIPDRVQSVEFVQIAAGGKPGQYRRFAGETLAEDHASESFANQRTQHILGLSPPQLR
jgi:hypothetical protein